MPHYYVNRQAQANGDHEVHWMLFCPTHARRENRRYLGEFPTCREAVAAAREIYPLADGCAHCSPDCHTR